MLASQRKRSELKNRSFSGYSVGGIGSLFVPSFRGVEAHATSSEAQKPAPPPYETKSLQKALVKKPLDDQGARLSTAMARTREIESEQCLKNSSGDHNLAELGPKTAEDARERAEEVQKDEAARTLFVGNIPLDTKRSELLNALGLVGERRHLVTSVRFRSLPISPKFAKNRLYGGLAREFTGTCQSKNAYVVLNSPETVKSLVAMSGVRLPSGHHLRMTSVSFKRTQSTAFPRRQSVFVGNLSHKTTEDDLWDLAEKLVGPVRNVRIVRDKTLYVSRGIAFIEFKSQEHAREALDKLKDQEFQERPIRVTKVHSAETCSVAKEAIQKRVEELRRKLKIRQRLRTALGKKQGKGVRGAKTAFDKVVAPRVKKTSEKHFGPRGGKNPRNP